VDTGPDHNGIEALILAVSAMTEERTTAIVQRYLDALAGDSPADPIIRALLDRAIRRLQVLCTNLLHRSYPRLTRPPLNLQPEELLSAVVERLLKAILLRRGVRVGVHGQWRPLV
jgi:hypothetical protein